MQNLMQNLGEDFARLYDPAVLDNSCEIEMAHIQVIALKQVDKLLGGVWKEFEAHALFFYMFTQYCMGTHFENLNHPFEYGL